MMAQAARDQKTAFKENQRNRLSVLLAKAGVSTEENKSLVEAFFDIKIEKNKDITNRYEASHETFKEVLGRVKTSLNMN